MKRSPMPPRSSRLTRTAIKPVNATRKHKEFVRAYHSLERVKWIKAQPCFVSACLGQPSENAHTGNGGMGRKAGYASIVPACRWHHAAIHQGVESFKYIYGIYLEEAAARTQALWLLQEEGTA